MGRRSVLACKAHSAQVIKGSMSMGWQGNVLVMIVTGAFGWVERRRWYSSSSSISVLAPVGRSGHSFFFGLGLMAYALRRVPFGSLLPSTMPSTLGRLTLSCWDWSKPSCGL